MFKILVGATYSTTNPDFPEVRVISELSREVDNNGNVIGACRGYQVQVVDGTYHRPMAIDEYGCFIGYDGELDRQTKAVLNKYKPRQ